MLSFSLLTEPASTSLVRYCLAYFSRCLSGHLAANRLGFPHHVKFPPLAVISSPQFSPVLRRWRQTAGFEVANEDYSQNWFAFLRRRCPSFRISRCRPAGAPRLFRDV